MYCCRVCNWFQLRTVTVISCVLLHTRVYHLTFSTMYLHYGKNHLQTQLQASSRRLPICWPTETCSSSSNIVYSTPHPWHIFTLPNQIQKHSTLNHCEYHLHFNQQLMLLSRAAISKRPSRGSHYTSMQYGLPEFCNINTHTMQISCFVNKRWKFYSTRLYILKKPSIVLVYLVDLWYVLL